MSIPPWAWEAHAFDEEADLTGRILATLDSADPTGTLYDLWPWVSLTLRRKFVERAMPLANAGNADLEIVVERFQYVVRTEWAERYGRKQRRSAPRPGRLKRLLRRSKNTS